MTPTSISKFLKIILEILY
ncbi:hypothetical protein S40285_09393 [Stachybotrys chlorohalonatus IBT 40285]|uniref:Uncharacterized protein n=1 Tax=Stachybotrys chlorohalonatus (strain IBT 40285) TaxID=1283841 RepID=A0A084QWY4_STAC4|nr:hypothetical protein S40285_09393 [Stachybotrys chlorohalonata IBT 40285]